MANLYSRNYLETDYLSACSNHNGYAIIKFKIIIKR